MKIALLLFFLCTFALPAAARTEVEDPMPDFRLTKLNGDVTRFSELAKSSPSGVVCLTFWCSFCPSCRDVERQMEALHREFSGKATFVAVDSSYGETPEQIRRALLPYNGTFPVLLDPEGAAADALGVKWTTTTFVVDRNGVVRFRGVFRNEDHDFAREALLALLSGKPVEHASTRPGGCKITRKS